MKRQPQNGSNPLTRHSWLGFFGLAFGLVILGLLWGCTVPTQTLMIADAKLEIEPETIVRADTGEIISFEEMVADLKGARIVYVGERHTDARHHEIQLQVIKALTLTDGDAKPMVGMEMFDSTYQPVLDEWSAGSLDGHAFLQKVHWYANWRFKFELYREILEFVQEQGLPLVGLNIPAQIPPKIAVGGLENLRVWETKHLPREIDTADADHRAYVEEIFRFHNIRGRENFEYFYAAQCVWEDAMAEKVAETIGEASMVVLAGNGHIVRKFGIPKRAFARTELPYRTLYLAPAGTEVTLADGDYIWATPPIKRPKMHPGMK
jgi:uncharacterized iron-regulated protein